MSSSPKPGISRSSSRSKRSTTNLANLRLAPLTAKYTDGSPDSGSTDGHADAFAKLSASHRSAPTSPRALSRSSSRRYLGGLSRRSSLYENESEEARGYEYTGSVAQDETRLSSTRLQTPGGPQVPKAKSEAALGVPLHRQRQRLLAGPGVQLKRKYNPYASPRSIRSGSTTPRVRVEAEEEDWLTRTGLAANSILQEQKGQSFLSSSRSSQTTLGLRTHGLPDSSDEEDDDDEGYEELAAHSLAATRSGSTADDELSPISTRASRWGSRYGSRRTSRRGSVVGGFTSGSRTPLASASIQTGGREGYFDAMNLPIEPDFLDEEGSSADEGMQASTFTSLGGLVDKLIGFPLFNVEEGREGDTSTESEAEGGDETAEEVKGRINAENARRREEKERLRAAQQRRFDESGAGGGEGGGWQDDARWLFGRAREAWL